MTVFGSFYEVPTTASSYHSTVHDSCDELSLTVTVSRRTASLVATQGGSDDEFTDAMLSILFVIFVGVFNNIMSLAVLQRRRMRHCTIHIYLTSLACADLGVLSSPLLMPFLSFIKEVIVALFRRLTKYCTVQALAQDFANNIALTLEQTYMRHFLYVAL